MDWKKIANALPGRSTYQCSRHWRLAIDPSIKKGPWSAQEDQLLLQFYETFGGSWLEISKSIAGRTDLQCRNHWRNVVDPSIKKEPWTVEDDRHLAQLQDEFGSSWVQIGKRMPGRSENQYRNRSLRVFKNACATQRDSTLPQMRRMHWTKAEDKKMFRLMREAGSAVNWTKIADGLPERNGNQCRMQWTETLDPSIKKGPWSTEEDSLLAQLHEQFKGKWVKISERIAGRPQTHCRARWYRSLKPSYTEKDAPAPGENGVPMQLQEPSIPQNAWATANSLTAENDYQGTWTLS